MSLSIRPATPDDRDTLAGLAYDTGYFGDSASRYFPDRELFAAFWTDPYLRGGLGNLIALRQPDSRSGDAGLRPVGFIVGSANPARYRRGLLRAAPLLLSRLGRPDTRRSLRYLLRAARYPGPHASDSLYPASLHLNVRRDARGLGAGTALLRAHLNLLREAGVPGVQLSTTTENIAALGLYRKLGFRVADERETPLWQPWLGRSARHGVMTRSLLED